MDNVKQVACIHSRFNESQALPDKATGNTQQYFL